MDRNRSLDNPAQTRAEDEFNRWLFSKRLADTIAAFDAKEGGPVIGLFGRWGYGKSTVLNFIREVFKRDYPEEIEIFEFNPWMFKDQETLVSVFHNGLIEALGRTLKGKAQKFGKILQHTSAVFSPIPIAGGALSKLGEEYGKYLSHKTLEQERKEAIEIMRASNQKVVVLIDDLDRLDKDEILLMLKLVRLTANFPQIVYVLAFDDEMVARAVGERYGGTTEGGRQFLEKIVQYPFALPAVGHRRLLLFILGRTSNACAHAKVVLSEPDQKRLMEIAESSFLPRLVTPRQAIRYANALTFALPMLKGEVDPFHQILIEALRVLYPELYGFVRDKSPLFTCVETTISEARVPAEQKLPKFNLSETELEKIVKRVMKAANDDPECKAGVTILKELFVGPPRLKGAFFARYFNRYFSYSIAADDISDAELESLVSLAEAGKLKQLDALLNQLSDRSALTLIERLRSIVHRLSAVASSQLARRLAVNGSLFVNGADCTTDETAQSAAVLVAELVLNCRYLPEERAKQAVDTLIEATPLPFAMTIFQEIDRGYSIGCHQHRFYNRPASEAWFELPKKTFPQMRMAVVERINYAATEAPPYLKFGSEDALRLLQFWSTEGRSYLNSRLKAHSEEATAVLNLFPEVIVNYDVICDLADPEVIVGALKKHFGEQRLRSASEPDETRIAREFIAEFEHRKVKSENQSSNSQESSAASKTDE